LFIAKLTTLAQETVNQRRFTVVDVGDNYNVTNVLALHC
jgi:hypothetical protein